MTSFLLITLSPLSRCEGLPTYQARRKNRTVTSVTSQAITCTRLTGLMPGNLWGRGTCMSKARLVVYGTYLGCYILGIAQIRNADQIIFRIFSAKM